jgi:hypothetical protein
MKDTVCKLCHQIKESGAEIQELSNALLRLQRQIQPVLDSYDKQRKAHLKCASCLILIGPDHLDNQLVPEPMVPRAKGQKRYMVCPDCYKHHAKMRMSVPQMRKYHQRLSEIMDKQEIEDLADLPSIEEAEEEAKKWALTTLDDVDA